METKSTSIYLKSNIKSLAIGRFDGVHLGHQKLFDELCPFGGVLIIDTGKSNLTPPKYLNNFLDIPFFIYELDDVRNLTPDDFIKLLKSDFPNLQTIVVGEDFRFGSNRSAGVAELKMMFPNVIVVEEFKINSIGVHSRFIRTLLLNGNVEQAKLFFGRNYRLCGEVITGQGIGSKELYATVNIVCHDFILPAEGVYVTRLLANGVLYNSVSFLGHRVSTDGNYAIETHILEDNFLLNSKVCIEFHKKLRDNIFFEDISELKNQISKDISDCTSYFLSYNY